MNIYPVKTEPEDRDDSKNGSHSLDRQSLSLALLSNLVLTVDESKNRLREICEYASSVNIFTLIIFQHWSYVVQRTQILNFAIVLSGRMPLNVSLDYLLG